MMTTRPKSIVEIGEIERKGGEERTWLYRKEDDIHRSERLF